MRNRCLNFFFEKPLMFLQIAHISAGYSTFVGLSLQNCSVQSFSLTLSLRSVVSHADIKARVGAEHTTTQLR